MNAPKPNTDGSIGTATLLIVEDEELLMELLRSLLESEGYTVLTAQDGETAVALYKQHQDRIALVLTDLGLPKLSGWETFRTILGMNPQVKVIVATGYLEPLAREEMAHAGADDFVQKPYSASEIVRKVREVLALPAKVHT
jgi:CheY-like chemotaxis protein